MYLVYMNSERVEYQRYANICNAKYALHGKHLIFNTIITFVFPIFQIS